MKIKKILVYTNGELLGDGLYKLDFINNLRSNFPKAKIFWLCGGEKTVYSKLLEPLSKNLIHKVIDIKKEKISLIHFILKSYSKNNKYDVVIDTQSSILKTVIIKMINHKIFLSATANWLFSSFSPTIHTEKKIRLIDKLNSFVEILFRQTHKSNAKINLYHIKIPNEHLNLSKKLLPLRNKYVVIAPGAGDKDKIWPLKNFIEVAKFIVEKKLIPVFFIGPGELHLVEILKKEIDCALFPELDNIAIKSGLTGPILAIALANRLILSIANDSGTGHIFSKSRTSLILLFSKHDPKKYAPNSSKVTIIDSKTFGGKEPSLIPYSLVLSKIFEKLKLLEI